MSPQENKKMSPQENKKMSPLENITETIKKPDAKTKPDNPLLLFITDLALTMFIGLPIAIIGLAIYTPGEHALTNTNINIIALLLLGVLIAPLVEETAWRAGLYGNNLQKGISATLLTLLTGQTLINPNPITLTAGTLLLALTGIYITQIIKNPTKKQQKENKQHLKTKLAHLKTNPTKKQLQQTHLLLQEEKTKQPKNKTTYWLSSISFGLFHITNYDTGNYDYKYLAVIPLITAPQIIGGLVLGHVRKSGLTHAILLHGSTNATILTLGLLA